MVGLVDHAHPTAAEEAVDHIAANLGSLGDAAFHVTAGTIRRAAVNSADRGEPIAPGRRGYFAGRSFRETELMQ